MPPRVDPCTSIPPESTSHLVFWLDESLWLSAFVLTTIKFFKLSSRTDGISSGPHALDLGACAGVSRKTGLYLFFSFYLTGRVFHCAATSASTSVGTGGKMVEGELEVRLRLLRFSIRMQLYHWCVHIGYRLLRSWMWLRPRACPWAPCASISFGRHAAGRLDLTIKGRILCSRLLQGLQFG